MKNKNPRYLSSFIILAIIVPLIYITSELNMPGRITGFVIYNLLSLYCVYEVVKHMKLSIMSKLFLPLISFAIFFLDYHETITIIKNGSHFENFSAITDAKGFLLIFLLTLFIAFDPKAKQDFPKIISTIIIINLVVIGIPFFFKSLYVANIYQDDAAWKIMVFIISISIISDTMGYFGGKYLGKHKLAPTISPKKTWEGAISGYVFAVIFVAIFGYYMRIFKPLNKFEIPALITSIIILPLVSPIGDLMFSAFKREYGIKDFSNIIPGHGGIMDRIDALTFVTIFFVIIISMFYLFQ